MWSISLTVDLLGGLPMGLNMLWFQAFYVRVLNSSKKEHYSMGYQLSCDACVQEKIFLKIIPWCCTPQKFSHSIRKIENVDSWKIQPVTTERSRLDRYLNELHLYKSLTVLRTWYTTRDCCHITASLLKLGWKNIMWAAVVSS